MPTTDGGYTRHGANNYNYQHVSITSIDATSRTATGLTRVGTSLHIDIGHSVGAVLTTPSLGEQWTVVRQRGIWMLQNKLKGHDRNQLIQATQGQSIIGSGNGPVELAGTIVNAHAPLNTLSVTVAGRPDASSVPAGTQVYDTDLGKPIWSNGTDWHDATGHVFYHFDAALTTTATSTAEGLQNVNVDSTIPITATDTADTTTPNHADATQSVATTITADGEVNL